MVHEYRDKTYIRKDILVLLAEYGELNQTKLLSYSGLNLAKHKKIIDELVERRLIEKTKIYGEVKLLYIIRLQKKEENLSSCVRSI